MLNALIERAQRGDEDAVESLAVRDVARARAGWRSPFARRPAWIAASAVIGVATVTIALAIVLGPWTALPPAASGSPSSTPAATVPPSLAPGLPGFTTAGPTSTDAQWTSVTWRRLPSGDALSAVSSVMRWGGGYVAIGRPVADRGLEGRVRTPVWVSEDAQRWQSLSPSVFGAALVLGVAEVPGRVVALTASAGTSCSVESCDTVRGPITAWSSTDGRAWTSHPGPSILATSSDSPLPIMVGGAGGLLAASTDVPISAAISPDGVAWQAVPAGAFPDGLRLRALWGQSYAALGYIGTAGENAHGVALWSSDLARWVPATMPPSVAFASSRTLPWGLESIVTGRDGAIALGGIQAVPGAVLWWQSSDARHWGQLNEYPPLGPWPGPGEGMLTRPDGELAGDGTRIVALRLGPASKAWGSWDGLVWRAMRVSGEVPPGTEPATVTVLPTGLLVVEGGEAWYGEASTTN